MLLTDPSLATLSPLPQHHDIPPTLPPSIPHAQIILTDSDLSFQPPSLSPPSIGPSPRDPRLSPRTPEEVSSPGTSLHVGIVPTNNNSRGSNPYEVLDYHISHQRHRSSAQRIPDFSYKRPQPHTHPTSLLNYSPHSTSSSQESTESGPPIQVASQNPTPKGRRTNNEQLKCTTCFKVFLGRGNLT